MRLPLDKLACALLAAACSTNKPPERAGSTAVTPSDTAVTVERTEERAESDGATPTSSDDASPTATSTKEGRTKRRAAASGAPATTSAPETEATRPAARSDANASEARAPDNTKVNERDTSRAALTPVDQGENATDLKVTQQIRQAVMNDSSLSFAAKNVKIITVNRKVTLRGPVKTEAERSSIDAAARKIAGAAMVDNQLEVTE